MSSFDDITLKRSILLTTRMRFSPQVQPIKETAIEKIIEQILFINPIKRGLSLDEIQNVFSSLSGGYFISPPDVRNSLRGLIKTNQILITQYGSHEYYNLSEEARLNVGNLQQQAESQFESVLNNLFKNAKEGISAYAAPFIKSLSIIFSQLGEECVRLLRGDVNKKSSLPSISFSSTLKKIAEEFNSIDHTLFETALTKFFQDSNPDFDIIKWRMAQNYFITKAIGIDPSGTLLSRELFEGATFYLDTNLTIEALEPKTRYHKSFLVFANACTRLDINLIICQISIDELQNWLSYQRDLLLKVTDQIPNDTAPKVQSIFYEIYLDKISEGYTNIDEIFISFESPIDDLKNLFNIQLDDCLWFNKVKDSPETLRFAEHLKSKYFSMRARPKGKNAAIHDAILLLRIQKLREEKSCNVWLITADKSLPGSIPLGVKTTSLAISLDALFQWISPLVTSEEAEMSFSAIFAEMIKQRVLPQEKFFDLEDFLIFNEMHISCKELPAEDVEECIRYIKLKAPTLDPLEPSDREKLSYEVSKFFTDPGRKYKQDIERLEKTLNVQAKENIELKNDLEKIKRESREGKFKRSAISRMITTIIIFLFLEGLVISLAYFFGEGSNIFQKTISFWPFLITIVPIFILIVWFFVGRNRLKALGWPFTKMLK